MSEVVSGVNVMQEFCRPLDNEYAAYIDYMNRKEAQRNEMYETYNLFSEYNDYMGNPIKTTGLFSKEKDALTMEEKLELKNIFKRAQRNESIMWQTVISFDNRWLEEQGVMDRESHVLDERKLKEVARKAFNTMMEKENLEHATWSASIHYNTDNLHVHFAAVEAIPMRQTKKYVQYIEKEVNGEKVKVPELDKYGVPVEKEEYVGRFKQKSIEACKRVVVNELTQTREINLKINSILRDGILKKRQEYQILNDKELKQDFLGLYELLKEKVPKTLMNYNADTMKPYREAIDDVSRKYMEHYHMEELEELQTLLFQQREIYREAYGNSGRDFAEGKMQDLYARMGNIILKEMKELRKQEEITGQVPKLTPEKKLNQEENLTPEDDIKILRQKALEASLELDRAMREEIMNRPLNRWRHEQQVGFEECEQMEAKWEIEEEIMEQSQGQWGYEQQEGFNEPEQPKAKAFYGGGGGKKKGSDIQEKYKSCFKANREVKKKLTTKEKYQEGVELLEKYAKGGNPICKFTLGEWYLHGREREISLEKAEQLFGEVLEQFLNDEKKESEYVRTHSDGPEKCDCFMQDYLRYRIGKQYNLGYGVEKDSLKAKEWYERSNSIYAKFSLANLYYYGEGVEEDKAMALKYYHESEAVPFSQLKLAQMYEKGIATEVSLELAQKYYTYALGNFLAMEETMSDDKIEYQIGRILYYGKGHEKNEEEGVKWFRLSAEKQNIYAKYELCKRALERGENMDEAIEELTKLAEQAELDVAAYALGKLYCDKKFEGRDLERGMYFLDLAAQKDNLYAFLELGKLYTNPELEIHNLEKGLECLQKAMETGNSYVYYELGKVYVNSELPVHDLKKGVSYLEHAMENDVEQAQYLLGKIYLDKNREIYNPEMGLKYLTELADKNNSYAQLALGIEYLKGENVSRNDLIGKFWIARAASNGNEYAKEMLNRPQQNKRVVWFQKRAMSELDRALLALQRTMNQEFYNSLKNIREYEWELEREQQIEME